MRSPLEPPPPPGFSHLAASVLVFASWITLLGFIGADSLGYRLPSEQTDIVIAVPALFRMVAGLLFVFRGTKLGWGMFGIEMMLFYVIFTDHGGQEKGWFLLTSMAWSSLLPAVWALRHRRWSAPVGLLSAFLAGLALHADIARPSFYSRDTILYFVVASTLLGWGMHLGMMYWILTGWRARNRAETADAH